MPNPTAILFPDATAAGYPDNGLKTLTLNPPTFTHLINGWIKSVGIQYLATRIYNISRFHKGRPYPANREASNTAQKFLQSLVALDKTMDEHWRTNIHSYDQATFDSAVKKMQQAYERDPGLFNMKFSASFQDYFAEEYINLDNTVFSLGCYVIAANPHVAFKTNPAIMHHLLCIEDIVKHLNRGYQIPMVWALLDQAKKGMDVTKPLHTLIKQNPNLASQTNILQQTPIMFCLKHGLDKALNAILDNKGINIEAALCSNLNISVDSPIYNAIKHGMFPAIARLLFDRTEPELYIEYQTPSPQTVKTLDELMQESVFDHEIWAPLKNNIRIVMSSYTSPNSPKHVKFFVPETIESSLLLDQLLIFHAEKDYEVDEEALSNFCKALSRIAEFALHTEAQREVQMSA